MKEKRAVTKVVSPATELRRRAETHLQKLSATPNDVSPEQVQHLLHELQVHQIELEMQNEELRRAQHELEMSRGKYFDLYDLAPVGYVTLSEPGLILEANLTAAKLLGVGKSQLLKRPLTNFIFSKDQDLYYLHSRKLFAIGEPQTFELRMVKPAGSLFWAHLQTSVMQDDEGKLTRWVVLSDITEGRQAEQALEISLTKYKTLFDTFPLGITVSDKQGNILETNRSAEKLLGISTEEHHQRNIDGPQWQIVRPNGTPMPADEYASVRALKENRLIENIEMGIVKSSSETTWISVSAAPMPLEEYSVVITYSDIGARKRAEEEIRRLNAELEQRVTERTTQLEEAQVQQRIIFDTVTDGLAVSDAQGNFVAVNDAFANLYGYARKDDLIGKPAIEMIAERDRPRAFEYLQHAVLLGTSGNLEYAMIRHDGSEFFGEINVAPIMDESNHPVRFVAVTRDITQRQAAEQTLKRYADEQTALAIQNAQLFDAEREQHEIADTLREIGNALTATLDSDSILDYILNQARRLVPHDAMNIMLIEDELARVVQGQGYTQFGMDAVGITFDIHKPSAFQKVLTTYQAHVIADSQTDPDWRPIPETEWIRAYVCAPIIVRGEVIGFLNMDSATPGFFKPKHVERLQLLAGQTAIALENARLHEKARAAADHLQSLAHHLVQAQENERARIARELHDEIGQALTAQIVDLHFLEHNSANPTVVTQRATDLKNATNHILEELHRLTIDLRPVVLDQLGLVAALRQYVNAFQQQHAECDVQFQVIGDGWDKLAPPQVTAFYRIVQQALTNVAQHAQAQHVEVLLSRQAKRIVLIVWDDGVGFDPEVALHSNRLGLTSMKERAAMLGGTLWIESQIGEGTTIHLEVPNDNSHSVD